MIRRTRLATRLCISLFGYGLAAHAAPIPGERTFIDRVEPVPTSVLSAVGLIFPESFPITARLISADFDGNLLLSARSTVSVTFVWEGAAYRNALGYFTYLVEAGQPRIVDRQLIFPNASFKDPNKGWGGGTLDTGDTVTLRDQAGAVRTFEAGERVGFFCVSDGWNGSSVSGWTAAMPLPFESPAQNAALARGISTTIDGFNPEFAGKTPELARRFAVLALPGEQGFLGGDDFVLVGVEDMRRDQGSDNDFNDLIFVAHSSVASAISSSTIVSLDPMNADADADLVRYTADAFPDDPERAFTTKTPSWGYDTIAFEDNYPSLGDADFNDAVVQAALDVTTRADGKVKEVVGTYYLVARGASLDQRFGVSIGPVPVDASGTLELERFNSDGEHIIEPVASLAGMVQQRADGQFAIRLDQIFPSTEAAFGPDHQGFVNTLMSTPEAVPAAARFRLVLDAPLDASLLEAAPFDPFLEVAHGAEWYDIHLVGKRPFADRPSQLPSESGAYNFVDSSLTPFALLMPYDWRYPLEKIRIGGNDASAYPGFQGWEQSRGKNNLDWYMNPSSKPARVTEPMSGGARLRSWTLRSGGS